MLKSITYIGLLIPVYKQMLNKFFGKGFKLLITEESRTKALKYIKSLDYILTTGQIERELLMLNKSIKLIQIIGAGAEKVDLAAAREANIPGATTGTANTYSVAEYIVIMALILRRRLIYFNIRII